jgi:hypothetical protein
MTKPRPKTSEDRSPAPGVINCHSLNSFIYEEIDQGIDIGYEEAYEEEKKRLTGELAEKGIDETHEDFDSRLEEDLQKFADICEMDQTEILVGDWKKNGKGLYEIDFDGNFGWAGSYSNSHGAILTVEYSNYVTECAPTSLCYRRRDTGGPCGDLDNEAMKGEGVLSFCLPPDYFA